MRRISIGALLVAACILAAALGAGFAIYLRPAEASRDSSGNYTRPAGNPVVTGTTISSTWANTLTSDIGTEITDSLSRSGKGGMTAALRGIDGTKASPAHSWTSETGSGLYRNGSGDVRLAISGTDVQQWQSTGVTFPLAATVTGAATFNASGSNPGVDVSGVGQTSASVSTSSSLGGAIALDDTGSSSGNGGLIVFGASQGRFAAIKGSLQDGANNTAGDIVFATRNSNGDSTLTERMRIVGVSGGVKIGASGTAISASYRGTTSWSPGSVSANTCATTTITLTGAAAGADCSMVPPTTSSIAAISYHCEITANTCTLYDCNTDQSSVHAGPSGTYACRAWNP